MGFPPSQKNWLGKLLFLMAVTLLVYQPGEGQAFQANKKASQQSQPSKKQQAAPRRRSQSSHARRAQEQQRCIDPDQSPSNREAVGTGTDRYQQTAVSGRLHGVYQNLADFCNQPGHLVEYFCDADGITMRNQALPCPQGEVCHQGRCAVPLTQCSGMNGSWESNRTYLVTQDIQHRVLDAENACFFIQQKTNVTLDCQNHRLDGMGVRHPEDNAEANVFQSDLHGTGIWLEQTNQSTIKNCVIQKLSSGVVLREANNNRFQNITIMDTIDGFSLSSAAANNNNLFQNNRSCNSIFWDFSCSLGEGNSGNGNHFNRTTGTPECNLFPGNPGAGVFNRCN